MLEFSDDSGYVIFDADGVAVVVPISELSSEILDAAVERGFTIYGKVRTLKNGTRDQLPTADHVRSFLLSQMQMTVMTDNGILSSFVGDALLVATPGKESPARSADGRLFHSRTGQWVNLN